MHVGYSIQAAIVSKQAAIGASSSQVELTVKILTGKATVWRWVPRKDTIRKKEDLQKNTVKLLHHNKKLEDEATLQQLNITADSTLFMIVSVEQIAPSFHIDWRGIIISHIMAYSADILTVFPYSYGILILTIFLFT